MDSPQGGIFALGTASHAYLEFDATSGREHELLVAVASLREPRTTMGGVNLVAGFRPELWQAAAPGDAPAGLHGFDEDLVGVDGYSMPATQHDAWLWLSASAYDVVFEVARAALAELRELATVADVTSSWPYLHDRDLTGFIDGTENPPPARRARARPDPRRQPRRGRLGAPAAEVAARHDGLGVAGRATSRSRDRAHARPTASSSRTRPPTRTSRAPTRTSSGRSSAATCRTAPSPNHGTMFVGFSARAAAAAGDAREHGRRRRRHP